MDQAKFTIKQVADATFVKANTIRTWYQRGHLRVGLTDKAAEGVGLARHFSARTAIAVAVCGALTDIGIAPDRAGAAATHFAHISVDERRPACLYPDGSTVILLAADAHSAGSDSKVINVHPDTHYDRVLAEISPASHALRGLHSLELDEIVISVAVRLGIDRAELWAPRQ